MRRTTAHCWKQVVVTKRGKFWQIQKDCDTKMKPGDDNEIKIQVPSCLQWINAQVKVWMCTVTTNISSTQLIFQDFVAELPNSFTFRLWADSCHATAEEATCRSLIKKTTSWPEECHLVQTCWFFWQSCTGLRLALNSFLLLFFSLPLFCITSSVGGEPGCGRGFSTITKTTTRRNKCVLDCIFVEVGMFASLTRIFLVRNSRWYPTPADSTEKNASSIERLLCNTSRWHTSSLFTGNIHCYAHYLWQDLALFCFFLSDGRGLENLAPWCLMGKHCCCSLCCIQMLQKKIRAFAQI